MGTAWGRRAITMRESRGAFSQEIDVHPAHQRNGLERRLIKEVIRWAQAQKWPRRSSRAGANPVRGGKDCQGSQCHHL